MIEQPGKTTEAQRLEQAVDWFAKKMKRKVLGKEKACWYGWDDKGYIPLLRKELLRHVEELIVGDTSQAVDVANLAMFLAYIEKEKK